MSRGGQVEQVKLTAEMDSKISASEPEIIKRKDSFVKASAIIGGCHCVTKLISQLRTCKVHELHERSVCLPFDLEKPRAYQHYVITVETMLNDLRFPFEDASSSVQATLAGVGL